MSTPPKAVTVSDSHVFLEWEHKFSFMLEEDKSEESVAEGGPYLCLGGLESSHRLLLTRQELAGLLPYLNYYLINGKLPDSSLDPLTQTIRLGE